jgi:MFS family permease
MADSEAPSKAHAVTTIASVEIDPRAERALVWKFDLRLLPVLAIMYLFNSLDKSNLGNAKTAGLEGKQIVPAIHHLSILHSPKDTLHLKGNQYNLILSIFFVPYVLTAPFLGLLGKKFGPNIVLPCMMLTFGLCTILVVAAYNFSGLFAIRWFLGMAESAFFPLVIYYQTT